MKIKDLVRIARGEDKIRISEKSKEKIKESRKTVEKLFQERKPVYGTTTGIGELADKILTPEQAKEFQKYLVYSHAGGYGDPVSQEETRAAIAARLNTLCKGVSGVRLKVVEKIAEILNKRITPTMYPASVGACGDLAPLAQAMLVPIGEGEAFYRGERLNGKEALDRAGVEPIEYKIRDGLAAINGSQLTTGMAALEVYDSKKLVKTAEITAAMSFEALKAVTIAFDDRLLKIRGFQGGVDSAENIRKLIKGSEILEKQERVQDAYSIRSTPQVLGSVRDTINFVEEQVEIELNGGADNPLFFSDGTYLTGANFQGTPIALPLEMMGMGITIVSVISERRLNRLLNPALNQGLPGFLVEGAGMYSGIMIPQYTAASLVNKNRLLSTPAATGSIPTAADQEDFVSMGTNTAIKTREIIDNTYAVVAIELLAATQALDLRKGKPGRGVQAAYELVRENVEFLDKDRPLYKDIETLERLVAEGKVVEAVEKRVGELK